MLIYEAYNTKNGKSYIGLTTKTLDVRKSQHLRSAKSGSPMHFHKAIRKYGAESFEWSVVATTKNIESLRKLEQKFISLHESWQLYNKSLGGEHPAFGMQHSHTTKLICRNYALKRWENRRAEDLWPAECFTLSSYKDAKKLCNIPKTTWYRARNKG